MKTIIKYCDLYRRPITLPIQSENKYSTTFGFIITILTFILFLTHFYLECYEVFDRKYPKVFSNRNSLHFKTTNSSLLVASHTLRFFINLQLEHNDKQDLLSYFNINSNYYTKGETTLNELIKFHKCGQDEEDALSYYLRKNFTFPEGINLCPSINFEIPVSSFDEFGLNFSLRECQDEKLGCKQDKGFYEKLRNKTKLLKTKLYFLDSEENMLNRNPYTYFLFKKGYSGVNYSLTVNLEGSVVDTQRFYYFEDNDGQFKVLSSKDSEALQDELVGYRIQFNSKELTVHTRTYKTINNAFSNAFSLFKLYSWIFSLLLNNYYSYNINTIIINKNFDYANSTKDNNADEKDISNTGRNISNSLGELVSNTKSLLKTYESNTCKNNNLTMSLIIKRITCFRGCFCVKKKNKTRKFYESSTCVIRKYLSIEQLLSNLIEYNKFKKSVIEKIELDEFREHERLILSCDIDRSNLNSSEVCDSKDNIETAKKDLFLEKIRT
jgi:hypothetical protein